MTSNHDFSQDIFFLIFFQSRKENNIFEVGGKGKMSLNYCDGCQQKLIKIYTKQKVN